jgi:hypothetical protein
MEDTMTNSTLQELSSSELCEVEGGAFTRQDWAFFTCVVGLTSVGMLFGPAGALAANTFAYVNGVCN